MLVLLCFIPGSDYALEVLKSGMIIEKIDLTKKPYYVFGRHPNCDVILSHPSTSRYVRPLYLF